MRISTLLLMPAPKDVAKARAAKIRAEAASKFYERFKKKLEELADEGRIPRHQGLPSQQHAAEILGLDQPTISGIINRKRLPRADRFAVICTMLGISADELLGLPATESEKARRLALDLLDPVTRREVYELLKSEYERAPKELEAADREVAPHMPAQVLPPESGRQSADTGSQDPTKRVRRVKSPHH